MFEKYQKDGNIDNNSDGYLDTGELMSSKRFVIANVDSKLNINFTMSSVEEIVQNDKIATQMMEDILKDEGYTDGKIPLQKDFLEYLALDTDRDTQISSKEIVKDIGKASLSATFKNFLLEQILAMINKNKDKVLNGITNGAFNSTAELDKQSKVLDKLLKSNGDLDSLSDEEKSIFSSTKKSDNTINIIDLLDRKEKSDTSKKYTDTQADNAKIFSLKV